MLHIQCPTNLLPSFFSLYAFSRQTPVTTILLRFDVTAPLHAICVILTHTQAEKSRTPHEPQRSALHLDFIAAQFSLLVCNLYWIWWAWLANTVCVNVKTLGEILVLIHRLRQLLSISRDVLWGTETESINVQWCRRIEHIREEDYLWAVATSYFLFRPSHLQSPVPCFSWYLYGTQPNPGRRSNNECFYSTLTP